MVRTALISLPLAIACDGREPVSPSAAPPSATPAAPSSADPNPAVRDDAAKDQAGESSDRAAASAPTQRDAPADPRPADSDDATVDAARDLAPPPAVERTGGAWPWHAWDRAEALTFNQFRARPGVPLVVVDDKGWSPHIADRKALDDELAKRALDLVHQTKGEAIMTKCPFPRHGIVLYADDVPIASINVCFECGDIMIWPEWDGLNLDELSDKKLERAGAKKAAMFDKAFPRWQSMFRDDIGFPIDPPKSE